LARLTLAVKTEDGQQPEFFFHPSNETEGRLDTATYGITVIRDEYVRKVVSTIKGIQVVNHYQMGTFDLYHDIYIFQKTLA
jgi:hypothetical protein